MQRQGEQSFKQKVAKASSTLQYINTTKLILIYWVQNNFDFFLVFILFSFQNLKRFQY